MTYLIDYTVRKFLHENGHRCYLQFECDNLSDSTVENPLGQVIATVIDPGGPDDRRKYAISRPHIRFKDAQAAVDTDHLPYLEPDLCDLTAIRQRLLAAGLT